MKEVTMGKGEEGGVRTDRFNTLLVFASIPLRLSSREKKKKIEKQKIVA